MESPVQPPSGLMTPAKWFNRGRSVFSCRNVRMAGRSHARGSHLLLRFVCSGRRDLAAAAGGVPRVHASVAPSRRIVMRAPLRQRPRCLARSSRSRLHDDDGDQRARASDGGPRYDVTETSRGPASGKQARRIHRKAGGSGGAAAAAPDAALPRFVPGSRAFNRRRRRPAAAPRVAPAARQHGAGTRPLRRSGMWSSGRSRGSVGNIDATTVYAGLAPSTPF